MTIANCVNSLGLVLDIIGAFLLWKFGLPANISRGGHGRIIMETRDEAEAAKAEQYDRLGNWGMLLLGIGFLLQLVSNFL